MLLHLGQQEGPLHRQLTAAVQKLISQGDLPVFAYLPSERSLARAIAVSRSTVVTAFDALRDEGWIQSLRGSGSFVSPTAPRLANRASINEDLLAPEHPASRFDLSPLARVDLSSAAPPAVPLVDEALVTLSRSAHSLASSHPGYYPRGLPMLRERIAAYHSKLGLPTAAEAVFVTSGVQPAIEQLISACLKPGDSVLLEDPTYRGAINAFRGRGLHVRTVPCGPTGLDVDALQRILDGHHRPRMLYLMSSIHSPTGATMPADHKRRLAEMTAAHGIVVVDDAALSDLAFDTWASRPLATYGDSENIFTVGSMSKLYWGGLRVGWIRASATSTALLARLQGRVDLGASVLSQALSVHLLDEAPASRVLRQEQLRHGLDTVTTALTKHLPEWSWQEPAGGASLWVQLPTPSAKSLSQLALRSGVALASGPSFSADGHFADRLRLPLTTAPDLLTEGVALLADSWAAMTRTPVE